jgi:hypothetical protein
LLQRHKAFVVTSLATLKWQSRHGANDVTSLDLYLSTVTTMQKDIDAPF